jgi:hypothetical protein
MNDLLSLISLLAGLFLVACGIWTIIRLQRASRFSWLAVLTGGFGSVLLLVVYSASLASGLEPGAGFGFFVIGAVAGVVFAWVPRLHRQNGSVLIRRAGWHVAWPLFAGAIIQWAGAAGSRDGLSLGFLLLAFAVGHSLTTSVLLLVRRAVLRRAPHAEKVAGPEAATDGSDATGETFRAQAATPAGDAASDQRWMLFGLDSAGEALALPLGKTAGGTPSHGMILGRTRRGSDILVTDPSVSRKHARLKTRNGYLTVEDLRSANGTWVNGHKVEPDLTVEVPEGALLQFGDVLLTPSRG